MAGGAGPHAWSLRAAAAPLALIAVAPVVAQTPAPVPAPTQMATNGQTPITTPTVVTSDRPSAVSVTLYRAPDRPADRAIDRDDPAGYALVTETRTISLPAGPAVIRFEGVAGNILPESAIVTGLPADVAEKNLDADLLSPRTLYDRALGRRVIVRRTDPATGRVIDRQATIRSGAEGAAVLQFAGGYEALRCSGLPETIVHHEIPDGLSARPTLSIATSSPRPITTTVRLSYLAGGFDWQADYVLTLPRGGGAGEVKADLFAWVTLASADVTSFPDARAQLIAGKPNREEQPPFGRYEGGVLALRCWPTQISYGRFPPPPPPPPPPPMMAVPAPMMEGAMDVVVTASRVAKAVEVRQADVGDLKLYSVPMPTTVASKAQKQVALLARPAVAVRTVYVGEASRGLDGVRPVLRLRNRTADGLGAPLPAGQVAVFREGGDRPILLGTASTDDRAIGEKVELDLPPTPGVHAVEEETGSDRRRTRHRLTVTNANPWPIAYEARFPAGDARISAARRLVRRDGYQVWETTVPANGSASLDYARRSGEGE